MSEKIVVNKSSFRQLLSFQVINNQLLQSITFGDGECYEEGEGELYLSGSCLRVNLVNFDSNGY